jgi:hypothetical protein
MAHKRHKKILIKQILCRTYPRKYHNHQAASMHTIFRLGPQISSYVHNTATSVMHCQNESRAAITKRDTATAQRNPIIANRHNAIALQNTRHRQVTSSNTKAQSGAAGNWSVGHFNDSRDADITTENLLTAAECTREVAFITYQIITEVRRMLEASYDALMAATYLLVQSCKLTWAVGCLTMAVGRHLYDTAKAWWKRLVA